MTSIIFWGTSNFAIPTLDALIKNGYKIAAVVTNPDEPAGRKNILTPPPVKVLAKKHKIQILQPPSLKDENFLKELPEANIFIVAAYGKIIPKTLLDLPKYGSLNIHPSLLPRWRGPSPIQYTILNGDEETGVTIIKIDERMDHGPVVAVRQLEIRNPKSEIRKLTYKNLHDTLAKLGAEVLIEALPEYLKGDIMLNPQDESKTTYSKILKKDDGRINWKKPAEDIERMVHALNPWPGAWTIWPTGEKIYRLRIEEADFTEEEPPLGSPGYIWQDEKNPLLVKTGRGSLRVNSLTLESKKSLSAKAFLNGHPQFIGTTLV